jgi:antitoxin component of MazEF toxin-antitoxin module
MSEIVVEGKILRWGNSFGIRIRSSDLEETDLKPNEEVFVRIEQRSEELELSELPTFRSGAETTAARHDAVLGVARSPDRARDGDDSRDGEPEDDPRGPEGNP